MRAASTSAIAAAVVYALPMANSLIAKWMRSRLTARLLFRFYQWMLEKDRAARSREGLNNAPDL
ncbi:hypothetical protein O1K_01352 [Xanthomonas fragariae LMG 25863]|nr:hypothetical protein BER92_11935 [Xanthomonas fragariae]ENZ97032.1 hypothetical protein O1K_01352 [Xanthomonas fragariae LMG 25863]